MIRAIPSKTKRGKEKQLNYIAILYDCGMVMGIPSYWERCVVRGNLNSFLCLGVVGLGSFAIIVL